MITTRAAVLAQLLNDRRTRRDFTDEAVSQEHVEALLGSVRPNEAGWPYPSAHDLRPVAVDRVSSGVDRASVQAAAFDDQPWLVTAPLLLSITADLGDITAEFADQDRTGLRGRDFACIEAGAAMQSLLLTATALDLGAVLVGGIRQEEMQAALGEARHIVGLIAVGHVGDGPHPG